MPDAEIWIVKKSPADAEQLLRAMEREDLRRDRYRLVALDAAGFEEVCRHLGPRNEIVWFGASFNESGTMQFDLNGLWHELPYTVVKF